MVAVYLSCAGGCVDEWCRSAVQQEALSPLAGKRATAFSTECGALSPGNTKISVDAPALGPDDAALAFATEGYYRVELAWQGEDQVSVLLDCQFPECDDSRVSNPLLQRTQVAGVEIRYVLSDRLRAFVDRAADR